MRLKEVFFFRKLTQAVRRTRRILTKVTALMRNNDADEMLELPVLGPRIARDAFATPAGRPGERFVTPLSVPKPPERFYFLFGKPISTVGLDHRDDAACAEAYGGVKHELETCVDYLLAKRETDPWRPLMPRLAIEAAANWTRQAPTFNVVDN